MDLIVPECQNLSLEGVRNLLCNMNQKLIDIQKKQDEFGDHVKKQVDSRPTMHQVISAINGSEESKVNFTVGLNLIQGILNNFEESVAMNLTIVQSTAMKYEQTMKKLIQTAENSLKLSHVKYQKAQECSRKNLKFVLNHMYQLHLKNKKRRILDNWKKIAQNKKKAAEKLIHLSKARALLSKQKALKKWERNSTRISIKVQKKISDQASKTLELHGHDLKVIKTGISLLQESKAEKSQVAEIENLALKADVRVMFQDIKSIIKTHTDSIKTKHEEEIKALSQDLRFVKESISQKADSRHIKEHLDLFMKLRADFIDLGKSHTALNVRMNNFDGIAQKENMDFKLGILDRKIAVIEQRMARIVEEKSATTAISATLCNFPQSKRPATSVNRTQLHSRKNSFSYN